MTTTYAKFDGLLRRFIQPTSEANGLDAILALPPTEIPPRLYSAVIRLRAPERVSQPLIDEDRKAFREYLDVVDASPHLRVA